MKEILELPGSQYWYHVYFFSKSTLLGRYTIQLNVDSEFLYYTILGANFSGICEIIEKENFTYHLKMFFKYNGRHFSRLFKRAIEQPLAN